MTEEINFSYDGGLYATADAAFLTGLERNADVVVMNCYAPLFVTVNPGGSRGARARPGRRWPRRTWSNGAVRRHLCQRHA
jgi:hypothetical protein